MNQTEYYDAVIVGAGVAGAIIAYKLGLARKSVLLLEAGVGAPASREEFMERFYTALAKTPEAPYPQNVKAPGPTVLELFAPGGWRDPRQSYLDQSQSCLPFGSTYQRRAGGTVWHWLGHSFRFLPNDFQLKTKYDRGVDWPISYDDLGLPKPGRRSAYYDDAEREIGVSADVAHQAYHGIRFSKGYRYPNPEIPLTLTDQFFARVINGNVEFEGQAVSVVPTPAGRNSRPYDGRRACAGNTSCIPICPIQAKYDPTVTLHKALATGYVHVLPQTVAWKVRLDGARKFVTSIDYVRYDDPNKKSPCHVGQAIGRIYVLAAHAIETPKLLLNSYEQLPNGVANSSGQVGRNLMDHPYYLRWGLTPEPTFPYRGPLATAGIESLRDGAFRGRRAAFRVDLGNEGWNLTGRDPARTTLDFVDGTDESGTNRNKDSLFGSALIAKLNHIFTRQFRFGFLIEQLPRKDNRVTLSPYVDGLGIPRPKIHYDLCDYSKQGFVAAKKLCDEIFRHAGIEAYDCRPLKELQDAPGYFSYPDPDTKKELHFQMIGAGHIVGTYRMGDDRRQSVVDRLQRSWDHPNLFLVGSGVFPTVATGNPTLTIAALAFWAADTILGDLR